ncbi:hypothetical protein BpHYR1_012268 [Brachionus plicatilis]|uniref:Uncharacterized protein n=1 Tax=Brachionus plicatilis TaxID=10195 RepID=A0A3M7S959_BRAPC|nr:hypothetical protein BpHYR1_012268 [Brachionus plicatilis]
MIKVLAYFGLVESRFDRIIFQLEENGFKFIIIKYYEAAASKSFGEIYEIYIKLFNPFLTNCLNKIIESGRVRLLFKISLDYILSRVSHD